LWPANRISRALADDEARDELTARHLEVAAERLYREAIEGLSHAKTRATLARAHLLYGEWLRREQRRVDAREPLRVAHTMLSDIGMEAFAERARREPLATGETVRKMTAPCLGSPPSRYGVALKTPKVSVPSQQIGRPMLSSV
jgi:hypothetical protein